MDHSSGQSFFFRMVLSYDCCTGSGMSASWFSKKREQFSMSFFHRHSLGYAHIHTETETNTDTHTHNRAVLGEEITSVGFTSFWFPKTVSHVKV